MHISEKEWKFLHERIVRLEMDCVHIDEFRYNLNSIKKELNGFPIKKIDELEAKLSARIEETNVDVVTCEVCGCLLERSVAIQGPSEIRGDPNEVVAYIGTEPVINNTEYIYHPYYCKIHAPKPKTKGKK